MGPAERVANRFVSSLRLPAGWFWSSPERASELLAEYQRELPAEHPLAGIPVAVVAHREGTDDILVRHVVHADRYSVVHLTWLGREEIPHHPTVEHTGSFDSFSQWESRFLGAADER